MGMQLKRGPEPQEPQGPEVGLLEGLMSSGCGVLVLLFFLVVLTWACFAGALSVSGNPPF